MKPHRRTVGQFAVLVSWIVRGKERRGGGEKVKERQTNHRKPHHPGGAPPFAAQAPEQRSAAGLSCLERPAGLWLIRGNRRSGGRHTYSEASEEKSTRGSTTTSAMSASRLPSRSRTVPISTDPITR